MFSMLFREGYFVYLVVTIVGFFFVAQKRSLIKHKVIVKRELSTNRFCLHKYRLFNITFH